MKIVVLELFDLPPAAGFCRELRYSDDPEWVLVGGDFGFHPGIVSPEPFHLMLFHLAVCQHHGEVRRVERVVSQTQLDAFEPEPGDFPVALAQFKMLRVVGFGFVHLARFKPAKCLYCLSHDFYLIGNL